jgi:hypothetical protein
VPTHNRLIKLEIEEKECSDAVSDMNGGERRSRMEHTLDKGKDG